MASLALLGVAAFVPATAAQAAPAGDGVFNAVTGASRTGQESKLRNLHKGKLVLPEPGAKGRRFQSGTGATPKIFGGNLASASEFPYIVGVVTTLQFEGVFYWYWCTGTIIAPNKVLTAAHCTADGPGTTRVIAGNDRLVDSNGQIVGGSGFVAEVGSTWTHPGWNIAQQYADPDAPILDDVSVLTLKQNLPSEYKPVSLSAQGDQKPYAAGTSAQIAGFGITSSDDEFPDSRLRKATVAMRSNADCAVPGLYDANRMICAGSGTPSMPSSDTCSGDSGGPLLVNGVQVGITDWGFRPCGSYAGYYERLSYYANTIKADLTRPPLVNADWTGDGHSDLLTRDGAGNLRLYMGSGFANDGLGGFYLSKQIGNGWGIYSRVFRVYNWKGDKKPSIMAMKPNGDLFLYDTDGKGEFVGGAKKIGTGWQGFTALMVTNNWLGNNRPSLLVRKSNGDLIRYTSNGAGGWENPLGTKIGNGWNGFNLFLTPGAWKGDGREVLIGRTSTGDLKLYQSDSKGGWTNPLGTKIGSGWGGFKNIIVPGDWSGDNMVDMLGVNSKGDMRLYTTNGYGQWIDASGKVVGTGWGGFNLVF
ncbi:trypsin-like serine protease [Micromonospora parva]|uniref:trypsin-like serine protease n=1 Tax=Micromonospora parva TaxID=1464048 RepID=UPI00340A282F